MILQNATGSLNPTTKIFNQFKIAFKEVDKKIMNYKPGFIKAMWCGDQACELKMKEIRGTKSRCILEDHDYIDDKCVVCGKKADKLVVWGIQY